MDYLARIDEENVGYAKSVFGDGKKSQAHCLKILNWAIKNDNKPTSITKISEATGVPRMSVHWIITDAMIRKNGSTLHKVAVKHKIKYETYSNWNKQNKYKRVKIILKATK